MAAKKKASAEPDTCGCGGPFERKTVNIYLDGLDDPAVRKIEYCPDCSIYIVGGETFGISRQRRAVRKALELHDTPGFWEGMRIGHYEII